MSASSSAMQQALQETGENQDEAGNAAVRVEISGPAEEGSAMVDVSIPVDRETQGKMQSVFQQVREQIRMQVGANSPKNSILELVRMVKDKEMEKSLATGQPGENQGEDEERKVSETLTNDDTGEKEMRTQELSAFFEKELEDTKQTLRDDFKEQIALLRVEMEAYADKAVKDVESKMKSLYSPGLPRGRPRDQPESKAPDKSQKSNAAPSLASRRSRVLTRTMTTIIPKMCAPVIIGPRAKSETFSSSRDSSSLLLLKELDFSVKASPGSKCHQSRRPLPPVSSQVHHWRKQTKAKQGNL